MSIWKLTAVATAILMAVLPVPAAAEQPAAATAQLVVTVPQVQLGDLLYSIDMPNDPAHCYLVAGFHWPPVTGGPWPVTGKSGPFTLKHANVPAHYVGIQTGPRTWHSISVPDGCAAVAVVMR